MFHHFHGGVHPKVQGSLDVDSLRRILEHVGMHRILGAQEWAERFREGRLRPYEICLTFDDNLRCQYDVAMPLLEDLGITAFWFVYSSPLDGVVERLELYRHFRTSRFECVEDFYQEFFRFLMESEIGDRVREALARFDPATWRPEQTFYSDDDRRFRYLRDGVLADGTFDRIMDAMMAVNGFESDQLVDHLWMDSGCWIDLVSRGHLIGLHSHTHPTDIASLPSVVQQDEYQQNLDRIHQVTGVPPTTAAHPCGSYSSITLEILDELGIEIAFAVSGGVRYRPDLEVQRIDAADLLAAVGASRT